MSRWDLVVSVGFVFECRLGGSLLCLRLDPTSVVVELILIRLVASLALALIDVDWFAFLIPAILIFSCNSCVRSILQLAQGQSRRF